MPPTRHSPTEMHRSTDDATGANIAAGQHAVTDGSGGFTYEEASAGGAFIDLGNLGATETLDVGTYDWLAGTLNADVAITVSGFTVDEGKVVIVQLGQDGTGGWDVTWDADIEFSGDDQPDQTAGAVTFFTLWTAEGDSTIYGSKVGGGGTAASTVTDETTFGIAPAVGTDTEYARQDHTHGTPGDDELQSAGHYELLMAEGSSPIEPLENGSGTDWLYVWVPGSF